MTDWENHDNESSLICSRMLAWNNLLTSDSNFTTDISDCLVILTAVTGLFLQFQCSVYKYGAITQNFSFLEPGVNKWHKSWWACMQCACKEGFMCMELCASKLIKIPVSSILMLFKVVSHFYIWNQIMLNTIRFISFIISFS